MTKEAKCFLGCSKCDGCKSLPLNYKSPKPKRNTKCCRCGRTYAELKKLGIGLEEMKDVVGGDDWAYWCFEPETPVLSNPHVSFIEEAKGVQEFERLYNGDFIRFKPSKLFEYGVTPEHPIFIVPIKHFSEKTTILNQPRWVLAKDLKPKEMAVVVPIPKENKTEESKDWFELAGWYLAEGYINKRKDNGIFFTLNPNEKENIERIIELGQKLNSKYIRTYNPAPNKVEVIISDKKLKKSFIQEFGCGARFKTISKRILEAEKDKLALLLEAWTKGDGNLDSGKTWTASKKLAMGMFLIAIKLGKHASITSDKSRKWSNNPIYSLYWTRDPTFYRYEYWFFDDMVILPIKYVKTEKYIGKVYNLKTESQTYQIPFIVHNCDDCYIEMIGRECEICHDISTKTVRCVKCNTILCFTCREGHNCGMFGWRRIIKFFKECLEVNAKLYGYEYSPWMRERWK